MNLPLEQRITSMTTPLPSHKRELQSSAPSAPKRKLQKRHEIEKVAIRKPNLPLPLMPELDDDQQKKKNYFSHICSSLPQIELQPRCMRQENRMGQGEAEDLKSQLNPWGFFKVTPSRTKPLGARPLPPFHHDFFVPVKRDSLSSTSTSSASSASSRPPLKREDSLIFVSKAA